MSRFRQTANRQLITFVSLLVGLVLTAADSRPAAAAISTFNSLTPATNAATRAAWLLAAGVVTPENMVDFESGFSDGQNVSGISGLFPGGLIITDTSGPGFQPGALIETGASSIALSNPVGTFSLEHNQRAYLELDFSAVPVDYVGFQDIDHEGTTEAIVTFVGGGTALFSFEPTAGSGNSAEFFGIFRNDMPRITRLQIDIVSAGEWGMDTIEYGVVQAAAVPEPSTLALFGCCGALMSLGLRRSWRRGR